MCTRTAVACTWTTRGEGGGAGRRVDTEEAASRGGRLTFTLTPVSNSQRFRADSAERGVRSCAVRTCGDSAMRTRCGTFTARRALTAPRLLVFAMLFRHELR